MPDAVIQEKETDMIYDKNETMRLLGYQSLSQIVDNEELEHQYREAFYTIKEKHPFMDFGYCAVFVTLGIIWGKRMERARRKRN